ncbi:Spo12 [Penicillium angulare]|uniref:Spo12 n=1 Tax=Penicillium angulare TaxID=116970 RepID=UPI0025424752|nr:Spo12 [Penicillium angulare]KAJ5287178.1 Spo12 [Penicillium angulare]
MDATTQVQPLADRPTNTHLANTNNNVDKTDMKSADLSSMDYHRNVLQGKLDNGEKQPGAYVSPSDELMSPCTKKLSDIKGKRFKNAGKPQSLFAKLGKKSYEQSSSAEQGRNSE